MRQPEYFEEIRAMRTRGASSSAYAEVLPLLEDVVEMRRYFLRQMFRIQAESICLQRPIFQTLGAHLRARRCRHCRLLPVGRPADARRISAADSRLPAAPAQQMMVIALGCLGMQEFDLGSDADLVFVIPDWSWRSSISGLAWPRNERPSWAPTPAMAGCFPSIRAWSPTARAAR